MTDSREEQLQALLSEEAAEWFLRARDADFDEHELAELLAWFKKSPQHIAEFLRMYQLDDVLRSAMHGEATLETSADVTDAVHYLRHTGSTEAEAGDFPDPSPAKPSPGRWKLAAAACTAAIALTIALAVQMGWFHSTLATRIAEWRHLRLNDGSTVDVGPISVVRVDIGDERRFLRLQHGDAYFEVAKDTSRPFIVHAGKAVVRATGTAFGVTRQQDRVVVTVKEGAVAVSPGAALYRMPPGYEDWQKYATGAPVLVVAAGEQVTVGDKAWPTDVQRVDTVRALAWTEQKLIFKAREDTIGSAAGEFNRRNALQLIIVDAEIADLPVQGTYAADHPAVFAQAVDSGPDARILSRTKEAIYLGAERREAHQAL